MAKKDEVKVEGQEGQATETAKRARKVKYFDYIHEDGKVELKFSFEGHEGLHVFAHDALVNQLILAGMKSYFQGIVNGAESVDQAYQAVVDAIAKFDQGEFVAKARGGRKAGEKKASDLAIAVAEVRQLDVAVAEAWIEKREKEKRGFKLRLRNDSAVAVVLARLTAEKAGASESTPENDLFSDLA